MLGFVSLPLSLSLPSPSFGIGALLSGLLGFIGSWGSGLPSEICDHLPWPYLKLNLESETQVREHKDLAQVLPF